MVQVRLFIREYRLFALALSVAAIALALDVAGIKIPALRTTAHIVIGIETILMALILSRDMIEDLRSGKYGVDILAVTAIVAAVLLGEYWTAMITVLMLTGGEALEDYAENRAKSELTALLANAPKTARIIRGRKTVEVPIHQVAIGNKVVIQPGELVPVDCVIVEGQSSFDESSLTGESLPIEKNNDDELLSGSVNMDGLIIARALRAAKDSQFEQILKLVKNAASTEAPFVRLADVYAVPFTFVSFVIAFGVWIYSGDPNRFLQVLVVATPCPLLLGAPIGLISGISKAAKHGIIIKNGSSLEKLAAVKTFAFDKTGTLTVGRPSVKTVYAYANHTTNQVLKIAAALEQNSTHILAKAIVEKAHETIKTLPKVKQQQEKAGYGISGTVDGHLAQIGRLSYLQENHSSPHDFKQAPSNATVTYVALNEEIIGYITFEDHIRPESERMLTELARNGIKHTLMITGDVLSVANTVAKKLGITDVAAQCLPGDKIQAISNLDKSQKPVAFVGDGVNDAPVLTAANVGIALGARGSAAASESADVVIMLDDVSKVSEAHEIAKNTLKITKQSILMGIGMSVILMGIFATGKFKPVYGAAIQELVDVSVILSALRAHGPFNVRKKLSR